MITDNTIAEKFSTILTGLTGVTLIEVVPSLPTPEEISQIGHLIIQIAIGLVTLYRLIKSPKSVAPKKNYNGQNPDSNNPDQDFPNHPVG